MRTNIEIDDRLLRRAMELGSSGTKKAAVEEALRLAVRLTAIPRHSTALGIGLEGNLEEMRASRFPIWIAVRKTNFLDSNRSVRNSNPARMRK